VVFLQHLADSAILAELGERVTQHRLQQNITQARLAEEAGVSKRTVERLEAGASTQLTNLIRILRALELIENLDTLVPEPAESPIQQLELQGKTRRRATAAPSEPAPAGTWKWGDELPEASQSDGGQSNQSQSDHAQRNEGRGNKP